MRHDPGWVGCGWLIGRSPDRCCTNPAVVRVRSRSREIVACDFHRADAVKWAAVGGDVTVVDIGEPTTLF